MCQKYLSMSFRENLDSMKLSQTSFRPTLISNLPPVVMPAHRLNPSGLGWVG